MFEKIYNEISSRKRGGKAATSDYAFSGTLKCGRCDKAMVGFNRGANFYRCTGRANAGTCDMPALNAVRLEQAFISALHFNSDLVQKMLAVPDQSNELFARRKVLSNELEQLKKRKKKWQEAYAGDVISLDDLRERTREDAEKEKSILHELESLPEAQPRAWTKDQIADILIRAKEAFRDADEMAKKKFLRELFDVIVVDAIQPAGKPARGNYSKPVIVGVTQRQSKSYL